MTTVLEKDLYEFSLHERTVECEECGAEVEQDPESDEMEEPHWRREERYEPFNDVFHALCDSCYAEEVSAIIEGSENGGGSDGGEQ
ncbi:hypothetical protein [Halomicrobium urmianum]|uniref:hypothetical protein n=1 Tax=Halomicrobium urmianum TaxID=1586233 RepID=UPI001CDA2075|nr:hypothetical protein [Halomicrobium urmianum]